MNLSFPEYLFGNSRMLLIGKVLKAGFKPPKTLVLQYPASAKANLTVKFTLTEEV